MPGEAQGKGRGKERGRAGSAPTDSDDAQRPGSGLAVPEHLFGASLATPDTVDLDVDTNGDIDREDRTSKVRRRDYDREVLRLQAELVRMLEWVRTTGARVVVLFEGRDAAGKGGAIKRITQYLNPRFARIVALPSPTERERSQWYFQRYVAQLPAAGEIALFDRSWYNRAGVEQVMGFCTPREYQLFLRQVPTFERMLVEDGIILVKYWFSVSDEEQERRFRSRLEDPMRRWKLSGMDLESRVRWVEYSRAKDAMFVHTDVAPARWWVVEADDKRRARINCMAHLLDQVPYTRVDPPRLTLPDRPAGENYRRPPRDLFQYVPDHEVPRS
jgi:polyphosphate kinase 2